MPCRLLKDQFLPDGNDMPPTRGDAKKLLQSVGMDYTKIHACPNDCVLFRNEYEHLHICPKCGAKRFREDLVGRGSPRKGSSPLSYHPKNQEHVQMQIHSPVNVMACKEQIY